QCEFETKIVGGAAPSHSLGIIHDDPRPSSAGRQAARWRIADLCSRRLPRQSDVLGSGGTAHRETSVGEALHGSRDAHAGGGWQHFAIAKRELARSRV